MPSRPARRLYFAYGSNLSLRQMATRCPSSIFIGRGILPDYCWQINTRGYANVYACPGYSVHGLVYEMGGGGDDETRLDRSEGVNSGAYDKVLLDVLVYPARRRVATGRAAAALAEGGARGSAFRGGERLPLVELDVLVYLSEVHVEHGTPKEEYIGRMNRGIQDAVAMGVPALYFENAVRRIIPDRPVPAPVSVLRRAPTPRIMEHVRRPSSSGLSGRARARSVSGEEESGGLDPGWETGDVRRRSWAPDFASLRGLVLPRSTRFIGDEDEYQVVRNGGQR